MGIAVFIQLHRCFLLLGDRKPGHLPNRGQDRIICFFFGISIDPQDIWWDRKAPINRRRPVQRTLNIDGIWFSI